MALYRIDAEVAHALELDLGFHAFGDELDPEVAGGLGDALMMAVVRGD